MALHWKQQWNYALFVCDHFFFCNKCLDKFAFSTNAFSNLFFPLSVFSVFSACSVFQFRLQKLYNISIIIVYVGVKYSLISLYKKQFVVTNIALWNNEKHAPREVLSFKNLIYQEKWGTFTQNEGVQKNIFKDKIFSENLRSRTLIWTFGIAYLIVEITEIKYGLLSKHLFQKTHQHGGCETSRQQPVYIKNMCQLSYEIKNNWSKLYR